MKEKILIIEDDPLIRNELKTLLQSNSYKTVAPEDFSDVIDQIKAEQPHLIILDIKLPGTSGFSLCTEIRTFSEVPIIFVTSCNTDMDELNSIMLGGDAFITKPYNTAILLAKIASLLKKVYPTQQREQIVYGDAVLHLESSSLDYHGQSVELTKNELKILYYLFKNGGKICSRGDMIEYLWDNQLYVDDNALSVNINRIREKLAGIGLTDFIKTKHRYEQQTILEKQATISADEPCLYGCTHCIFAGVRQFGFRSSIDPDCMGIDFADGTCPHLLETEAADEKTSGYGGAAFRKIPYFRSDGAAGTGRGSGLLSAFENGWKIHVGTDWRSRAGTPGVQRIH